MTHDYGLVVLRLGFAAVYLWFGFSQIMAPDMWVSWVPTWTTFTGLDAETIVSLNGWFELIAGSFLAVGLFVRIAALLLALHVMVIVLEIGLTAIGVRDIGLGAATLALALLGPDSLTLDRVRTSRPMSTL